jgi:hypothetical protein
MITRSLARLGVLAIIGIGTSVASDGWVVRQDGIGPVKIGMRLSELNTILHEKFAVPESKDDQGCFYVSPTNHPQISFMIEDGRLVRIDAHGAGVSTAEGIQVGDSEAHALQVYGPSLKVTPHAYTGPAGHYLTIRSKDGLYGVRFETENEKIKTFYAGRFKAIQYIEGCQ